MSVLTPRRLRLPAAEVAELHGLLGLPLPPGFAAERRPVTTPGLCVDGKVQPALAAGLTVTCAPRVGVLVRSTVGDVAAALGVAGDIGGGLLRVGGSAVEVSAWPVPALGAELARCVPPLPSRPRPVLHLPLPELPRSAGLRESIVGTLHATVVAPGQVVGQVVWLASRAGWLTLEPAEVRGGVRWVAVRPVEPVDLARCIAPLVAEALA